MKILTLDSNEEVIVIDEEEAVKDEALTAEEIASLKELATVVPQLLELVKGTQDEEDPDAKDADEDEDEDKDEEEKLAKDSFKSVGATTKKKVANDSEEIDRQLDIENAWSKRLQGGK